MLYPSLYGSTFFTIVFYFCTVMVTLAVTLWIKVLVVYITLHRKVCLTQIIWDSFCLKQFDKIKTFGTRCDTLT